MKKLIVAVGAAALGAMLGTAFGKTPDAVRTSDGGVVDTRLVRSALDAAVSVADTRFPIKLNSSAASAKTTEPKGCYIIIR